MEDNTAQLFKGTLGIVHCVFRTHPVNTLEHRGACSMPTHHAHWEPACPKR